jgi:hypothetical protein
MSLSFDAIYKYNLWLSGSGTGSIPWNNHEYIEFLQSILEQYQINTVVDIACGDYRLWKKIKYEGKYLGIDIVQTVIVDNNKKYANHRVQFINYNVLDEEAAPIQHPDLVIIKDVFIHLPYKDIFKMLHAVNKMNPKYILLCEDAHYSNPRYDIRAGLYRPISFKRLIQNEPVLTSSYYEKTYLIYIVLVCIIALKISPYFLLLLFLWIPQKNMQLFRGRINTHRF